MKIKQALAVTLVGVVVASTVFAGRPNPEDMEQRMLDNSADRIEVVESLELTPTTEEAVVSLMAEMQEEMRALMISHRAAMEELKAGFEGELAELLTEEELASFEAEMKELRREKMREFRRQHHANKGR
jgi:hypothetical protein